MPEPDVLHDRELCSLVKKGDEGAFKSLFDTYYGPLFGFFRRRGMEHALAEDMAQDVFVNVWNRREHLDPNQSMRGYLFTSAYNSIKMHLRKKSVRDAHAQTLMNQEEQTTGIVEEFDVAEKIKGAIDNLPEAQQAVFVMHRYDGLSYKEIAQALELSQKTIESRMSKALKSLRLALKHLLTWIVCLLHLIR